MSVWDQERGNVLEVHSPHTKQKTEQNCFYTIHRAAIQTFKNYIIGEIVLTLKGLLTIVKIGIDLWGVTAWKFLKQSLQRKQEDNKFADYAMGYGDH